MISARRREQRALRWASGLAMAAATLLPAGCADDCCTTDGFPIPLARAPLGAPALTGGVLDGGVSDGGAAPDGGALLVVASSPDVPGGTFSMVVDTASPFTLLSGGNGQNVETTSTNFDLYGAGFTPPPLRASFNGWDVLRLPLQPVGNGAVVQGVLGADLLHDYSVELRFGARCAPGSTALCASMTLWNHLGADQSILEDAGYAVIYFTPFGGGEITANGDPDFLGLRGPLTVPATRVVLRGCAAPDAFSPEADGTPPFPACCTSADAARLSTGADLSLLVDTGVGPLVLAASAWARVVAAAASSPAPLVLPAAPATAPAPALPPLQVASWPTPIPTLLWTAIPRYALINLEAGTTDDPGPCVELARARRTEIVSYDTVMNPSLQACGQPCDVDPNNSSEAQNSAAYLEIGGAVPVAVISDDEPFLQGLRFDVLPEGPELDGLVGANALGRSRVELDYLSSSPRAVFSCETDAPRSACWAAARCPQLPDHSSYHYCFGLPAHTLPPSCAPSGC